ncbi:MAG: asparagine--tRNA ligase [Candidatus Kapabacteria bacterium]|nr:asparagine--tRNA ligase [Candidatus Kapabacteria bacterium]MCS7169123.1 asparagine--tRNA ligase [Candidatus Kapabacteria bacterium]MDW7997779.1 asparagine--tRNA ligase [Bacteroidota bacterium]MDW8225335.1 asparagine--tRNA ligase [Bacteroidota bacterium]
MHSRYRTYQRISDLPKLSGEEVVLRGWVADRTDKGRLQFLRFRDGSGFCQLVVFQPEVPEDVFMVAQTVTQESSVEVRGLVRRDERAPGGYEIQVHDLRILHRTQGYPIAPKEHGVEFLLEHRHLWLRSARQHAIMRVRAAVIRAICDFLDANGFVRIDAPILTANACEGTTTLFELDYFDLGKAYLSQSGQLYAEAAAMAHGRVYTLGPTFRAERSKTRRHLTEFWMVEPEAAFFELDDDMDLAEDLVEYVVQYVLRHCEQELRALGRDCSQLEKVKRPFYRISYTEAVEIVRRKGAKLHRKLPDGGEEIVDFPWGEDFGAPQEDAIMEEFEKPCIIHRYPAAVKAFYMKRDPENPDVVLAMDMLAPEGGGEIIGGSQREDDYGALLQRLREQGLPEDAFQWYLDLRRYGSVPHSGFGLGIERTVKWITGVQHIREVIPFPRMLYRIVP